jgi:Tfp pilus assembly protein PilF
VSLIANALKRAQQEKARRESRASGPVSAPVLVPLRGLQPARFNWPRTLMLSAGGLAVVTAIALVVARGKGATTPLPTVPPITSTILRDAIADSATRSVPRATIPTSPRIPTPLIVGSREPVPSAIQPEAPRRTSAVTQVGPRVAVVSAPVRDTAAALRREPSVDSVAAARPIREPQQAGRLRIAVEQPPMRDAARLFAEAVTAHRAGDFGTARSLYERVLTIAPNDADALNNLGVLLSAQREFERALDLLRRAASIAPRSAGTWNNIGTVLREQGKSSDAVSAFRHALTLDPNHQGARIGLAQQYLAINALAQAKDVLDEVLAVNPMLPEAQYTLGQVLELQGDRDGAVRAYSAFIRVAPARLANHVELVRRRLETLTRAP